MLQAKPARMMRAATGFHCDNTGRQFGDKIRQPMTLDTFAKYDRTSAV
jgi:hypothetical protein